MPNQTATPVVIESPYAGKTPTAYRRNIEYLHATIQDCLRRGEVPYASHGFFPGALDDTVPEQRAQGIEAGFKMAEALNKVGGYRAFYTDRGNSTGMGFGRDHSERVGMLYIPRTIGAEWAVENDPVHCDHLQVTSEQANAEGKATCPDCGQEFETTFLPKDAIKVALAWMAKKA